MVVFLCQANWNIIDCYWLFLYYCLVNLRLLVETPHSRAIYHDIWLVKFLIAKTGGTIFDSGVEGFRVFYHLDKAHKLPWLCEMLICWVIFSHSNDSIIQHCRNIDISCIWWYLEKFFLKCPSRMVALVLDAIRALYAFIRVFFNLVAYWTHHIRIFWRSLGTPRHTRLLLKKARGFRYWLFYFVTILLKYFTE